MQLHLKHPLEPDSAPLHAADIVASAADISGTTLDYSPESIDLVEEIVDELRADGATGEEMAESMVGFGCYIGEILTRHAGGTWRRAPAAQQTVPLVVELPDARQCRPIDWMFRRLELGDGVSLHGLYAAACAGGGPRGEGGPAGGWPHG